MLNISYRKIGGLHFVKLGRLSFSWCISRRKPLAGTLADDCRSFVPATKPRRNVRMPRANWPVIAESRDYSAETVAALRKLENAIQEAIGQGGATKSELMRRDAEKRGLAVIDMKLPSHDDCDWRGLPRIDSE